MAPGVAVAGRSTPVLVTLKQLDARHRDAANVTLRLYPDPVTPSAPTRAVAETNVFIQGITSTVPLLYLRVFLQLSILREVFEILDLMG